MKSRRPVGFNRDIRPILSDKCFACHGPDQNKRKADLRLDTREGATADRGGYAAVVPGDLEASELIARINAEDDDSVMPPRGHPKRLTPPEKELLGAGSGKGPATRATGPTSGPSGRRCPWSATTPGHARRSTSSSSRGWRGRG